MNNTDSTTATFHEGPTTWRFYDDRRMPVAIEFCVRGHQLGGHGHDRKSFAGSLAETYVGKSRIVRCDGAL